MGDVIVNHQLTIPESELRVAFVRSGGPGGQNVNKVASKVELRWNLRASQALDELTRERLLIKLATALTNAGELIIVSTLTRDQARNRADAEAKLAALLRAALHRPKARTATKPTRGSKERRISEKKRRGAIKKDRRFDD